MREPRFHARNFEASKTSVNVLLSTVESESDKEDLDLEMQLWNVCVCGMEGWKGWEGHLKVR